MSLLLSAITISPLSSTLICEKLSFINDNRQVTYTEQSAISGGLTLTFPEFFKNIKNLNFKDNYFTFVTDYTCLSSCINTLSLNISGDILGSDFSEYNVKYDTVLSNFTNSVAYSNETQFLWIVDKDLNFNVSPLKTKFSITGDQYSIQDNYRNYQKIYDVADSLFLQFKIDKIPFDIRPDKYSILFNSYNVVSCYINDAEFIKNGATGGNCPMNSDIIFFEQSEYGKYTNNGTDNVDAINNGTLLCLWLSSQTVEVSSQKIWMERWYDPNTVSQGTAFIAPKNDVSQSFSYISDIPSVKILSEKEKMTYLRYGPERNSSFVNTLSSNLQLYFTNWDSSFNSEVNGVSGFIIGNYNKLSDSLVLNGSNHAHIPPEDPLFIKNDMTVALWANADDWSINNDSQFFGDFYNQTGYGIFYNTGTPDNLISIPTSSNNIFSLNSKGFKVFEKDLKNDLGLSAIAIDFIKTDLYGNRWLYDSHNKNLYKIENDDLIVHTIPLYADANITKIECNSNNEIYVLDSFNKMISAFDSGGIFISVDTLDNYSDNFTIDLNDNTVKDFADFLIANEDNKIVKVLGSTVFVDNIKILHLDAKPATVKLDSDDFIWCLINNRIVKIDKTGTVIFDKSLNLPFLKYDGEMCFVKNNVRNREVVELWIIFNQGKYLIVLDIAGNLIRRTDLTKLSIGQYFSTLSLNVRGDFSGFDNKRRFEKLNGMPVSITNPAFSVRVCLNSGSNKKVVSLNTSTLVYDGWTHLAFTLNNKRDSTVVSLFVNGKICAQKEVNGNYSIDYGYGGAPFIIGGNSGKLGAKNLEKSITHSQFFIGQVDEVRVYRTCLTDFSIFNLSLDKYYNVWKNISFYIKSPETTLFEEIDTFHINRYKGFKSNFFNIKIKNFTDNPDLRNLVMDYINANISQMIPVNTVLNEIIFE
jgi:hypothetical protein